MASTIPLAGDPEFYEWRSQIEQKLALILFSALYCEYAMTLLPWLHNDGYNMELWGNESDPSATCFVKYFITTTENETKRELIKALS